jgi:hypothetical protein
MIAKIAEIEKPFNSHRRIVFGILATLAIVKTSQEYQIDSSLAR